MGPNKLVIGASGFLGSHVTRPLVQRGDDVRVMVRETAMCVANTYGPRDWQPTPHGGLLALAAAGKMPLRFNGMAYPVVGIEDAASAMLLAADKGRNGERYIVSERFMKWNDLFDIAADAVGARRPRIPVPFGLISRLGPVGDIAARILRRDLPLNTVSIRLAHIMSPMDHSKVVRELGWQPTPTPDAIRRAAQFFVGRETGVWQKKCE